MDKLSIKVIAILVTLVMISLMLPGMAETVSAANSQGFQNIDSLSVNISKNLSPEDLEFLNKMKSIFHGFSSDNSGKLVLDISTNTLKNYYNFTEIEIRTLQTILEKAQQSSSESNLNHRQILSIPYILSEELALITPQMHLRGTKIYFTHDDVRMFLLAAAQAGPMAVKAALFAVGTLFGGPIGAKIAVILAVIGIPSIIDFTYIIIQAAVNRQGVYIGIRFNGIFPIIVSGTW